MRALHDGGTASPMSVCTVCVAFHVPLLCGMRTYGMYTACTAFLVQCVWGTCSLPYVCYLTSLAQARGGQEGQAGGRFQLGCRAAPLHLLQLLWCGCGYFGTSAAAVASVAAAAWAVTLSYSLSSAGTVPEPTALWPAVASLLLLFFLSLFSSRSSRPLSSAYAPLTPTLATACAVRLIVGLAGMDEQGATLRAQLLACIFTAARHSGRQPRRWLCSCVQPPGCE